MADNLTTGRVKAILAILGRYPAGATLQDIARDLPDTPGTRTLRNWLDRIQLGGAITIEDRGDDTLVRLKAPAPTTNAPPAAPAAAVSPPPTTTAAAVPPARLAPTVAVPDQATPPSPIGTTPAPAAASASAPLVAGDEFIAKAIRYIVTLGIVPESATMLLQEAAREEGLRGPAVTAFVDQVMTVLGALTAAEAATTYDITAAQYQQWAEHCAWAGYPLQAAPPPAPISALPAAPASPVSSPSAEPQPTVAAVRDRGPSPAPHRPAPASAAVPSHPAAQPAASPSAPSSAPSPVVAAVRDRGPSIAPDAPAPAANAAPSPIAATAPVADAIATGLPAAMPLLEQLRAASGDTLAAARRLDWRQMWSARFTVAGHTLSGPRLLFAGIWAGVCLSFLQHNLTVAASLGVLSVVVVALPLLAFLWLDRAFTWAAGVRAFAIGGSVLYLVGDRVRAVGEWLVPRTIHVATAAVALFAGPAAPSTTPRPAASPPSTAVAPSPPSSPPVATDAPPAYPTAPDTRWGAPPPPTVVLPPPADPPSVVRLPPSDPPPSSDSTPASAIHPPPSDFTPPSELRPPPLPPYPAATGAYILSVDHWVPLPRNGEVLEVDDGRPRPGDAVAMLIFSGPEDGPRLPRSGGLVVYVGPLAWTAKQLKSYPTLQIERFYPMVELAAIQRDASGVRWTWWRDVLPGVRGIGETRVAATLEHPAPNVTVLRPSAPLPPGRYGLACGSHFFELAVD